MAIINNNVQNVKFLRNGNLFATHEAALTAINNEFGSGATIASDGTAILARYGSGTNVKTLVGFIYFADNENKSLTILDVEGASADVEALRQEINAKLGGGIGSGASETVTAQLTALSGNAQSTSAETSVAGAKAYAYDLLGTLEYTDTAETGSYVSKVDQVDGKITVTRVELPSSADTAVAKKFVTSVAEDKGQIVVSRGEISSSGKTIVLTDNADGGVNFEANVDGTTIIVDEETGVMSVASSALVQYEGDNDTIQISSVSEGVRTVSSPLTIQKVTTGLSEEVKEEYHLVGAGGTTIGDPVKIYKDSHIVSIEYQDDPDEAHYQNLIYTYVDVSGNTQEAYVDISELVLEAEFASGTTVENHVVRGVVDPTSEKDSQDTPVDFLTVGANGFKVSGIKDEIDRQLDAVVEDLDADVSGNSTHVTVGVEEVDGVITTVTVSEDNIANADDLAGLSGKTITEVNSSNSSISAETAATTAGTVKVDLTTDASKIQMSGFTADASGFTAITEASSVTGAVKAIETAFIESNGDIAEISGKVETISGDVDTIKPIYLSGVSVNGSATTVSGHVAGFNVTSSTSATTASNGEAITVQTDQSGNITLGLSTIDCGYYA